MTDFDAGAIDPLRPFGAARAQRTIKLSSESVPTRIAAARPGTVRDREG